jgi:hypothetical protein
MNNSVLKFIKKLLNAKTDNDYLLSTALLNGQRRSSYHSYYDINHRFLIGN